ncbi:hypothetical protein [Thermogutta sp.]|uniref:hypothetical protein n=1 Tax=Thermogutta sp. TaxID=1962930 RepID=UPI0025CDE4A4|nr:hypothetical protein [Thermogutta sp.]
MAMAFSQMWNQFRRRPVKSARFARVKNRGRSLPDRATRRGVLTFEWVILITLLVLGVVGAYTAFRDGVIDELGDICGAVLSVDQSFETHAPDDLPCAGSWGSWQDDDAAQNIERGRNL